MLSLLYRTHAPHGNQKKIPSPPISFIVRDKSPQERPMGAIDFKTNITPVADLFESTERSYGKPTGVKEKSAITLDAPNPQVLYGHPIGLINRFPLRT
jgi:hypothetical protein